MTIGESMGRFGCIAVVMVMMKPNHFFILILFSHFLHTGRYLYLLMRNAANCGVLGSDSQIVFPSVS